MRGLRGILASIAAVALALPSGGAIGGDLFRPLTVGGAEVRWLTQRVSTPILLRYAIADQDIVPKDAINCTRVRAPDRLLAKSSLRPADLRWAVREATTRWQRAANISFVETRDAATADVVIGEQADPKGLAFTNLTLAEPTGGSLRGIAKAQICLNPDKRWKMGFDGNLNVYDLVHAISHEIGHAIGLDHPSASGHLMSFRYLETNDGLSSGDALGAVSLYGAKRPPVDSAAVNDVKPAPTAPAAINRAAAPNVLR